MNGLDRTNTTSLSMMAKPMLAEDDNEDVETIIVPELPGPGPVVLTSTELRRINRLREVANVARLEQEKAELASGMAQAKFAHAVELAAIRAGFEGEVHINFDTGDLFQ